jgi:hypothetical protein
MMGIQGWGVIAESATLTGTLQSEHYSGGGGILGGDFNDYDSNLEMLPAPGFEHMATNQQGVPNPGGIIECEIHLARDVPSTPDEAAIFAPCVGKTVTLTGPFVEDASHNWKTEIHPIDSLLAFIGTDGPRSHVRLGVFSDDWHVMISQPLEPPFARTDRVGSFAIPFPSGPQGYVPAYIADVASISAYQSAEFQIFFSPGNEQTQLWATVHSGTPDNNQGLYVADVFVYWRPQRRSFQALDPDNVLVVGTDGNLWLEHPPFGHVPPQREQVDGSVLAFQELDVNTVFVLGVDGNLWLERAPFGHVPQPQREQIDGNVLAFQAVDVNTVFVLGTDGKLWLEHAPFGHVPQPQREQIDGNVLAFQALDSDIVLVLGFDGNLWLEQAPFGTVPPSRQQVDGNVQAFRGSPYFTDVFVLGDDGNLWQEQPPFGHVPPQRHQVDGNVQAFEVLAQTEFVWVLGTDGKLWLEQGPFGTVPPQRQLIDANVQAFQPLDLSDVIVLGTDGNLWLEHAPFGSLPPRREQIDANVRMTEPLVQ